MHAPGPPTGSVAVDVDAAVEVTDLALLAAVLPDVALLAAVQAVLVAVLVAVLAAVLEAVEAVATEAYGFGILGVVGSQGTPPAGGVGAASIAGIVFGVTAGAKGVSTQAT